MKKIIIVFFVMIIMTPSLWAANLNYDLNDKQVIIHIDFEKSFDSISQLEFGKKSIVKLRVNEDVDISQEFWGTPLAKVSSIQKGKEVQIVFEFLEIPVRPVMKQVGNGIDFKIIFSNKVEKIYSGGNVYVRVLVGLSIILIFILLIYGLIKIFFKKNISTEIPGVGRGLGKVDIMPGKSLFFYELGSFIYILGLTGDSINLIDKITDENEINQIKSGFSKKKNFSSYLKYFSKMDMGKDIDTTSTIIRDKVNSLKGK